jgi:hypothetical protein
MLASVPFGVWVSSKVVKTVQVGGYPFNAGELEDG